MSLLYSLLFETKSKHLCGDTEGLSVNQIYRQMIRGTELSGPLKSNNCCSLYRLQALYLSDNHTGRCPNCLLMSSCGLQNRKPESFFFFPMTETLMEQQLAVTDSEQQVALQKYENENIFLLCFLDIAYKPRRRNLLIIPGLIAKLFVL